jgi:sulfide:quinone oxidoreductase
MRVVVLGAGFGGLELSSRLSEELGDEADVVLIDRSDGFVFGFSKLDVMFGRTIADAVHHPYAALVKPGVRFVQATVTKIDPATRHVETDAGDFDAGVLVVALGADVDPAATPGLVEGGHEFYTTEGAFAARDVLERFEGGRVVVGVTSMPFKCPPAPSETALMAQQYFADRGVDAEVSLVMPVPVPVPPSPAASAALLTAFSARGIAWHPERLIRALDMERKVLLLADGDELPCDLFLGVPVHHAPDVVQESGLCVDGWIPVDPLTLETSFPGVYAVGDVTSIGTPKAGVFAEGQAAAVADAIVVQHRGGGPSGTYDGHGLCYIDFGGDEVGRVDVTFRSGEQPVGVLEGPSAELAIAKSDFGTSRIRRWFDRAWTAY